MGSSAQQTERRDRAEGEVKIMLAARPQKITFGEMRDDMGVRGVLIYCADYYLQP
jgi:hypothetical protein